MKNTSEKIKKITECTKKAAQAVAGFFSKAFGRIESVDLRKKWIKPLTIKKMEFSFKKFTKNVGEFNINRKFDRRDRRDSSKFKRYFSLSFLPPAVANHIINIATTFIPYTIISILIYPNISLSQFLEETFSLTCIYIAIFFWFMDDTSQGQNHKTPSLSRYKIIMGITACAAPIIFLNNTFSVALVTLILLIFLEFVCTEYFRGCHIFSKKVPVYIICSSCDNAKAIEYELKKEYKILNSVTLSNESQQTQLTKLRKRLSILNHISFFPFPRKILCFFQDSDPNQYLLNIMDISVDFSVPIFNLKYTDNIDNALQLSPFSVDDLYPICVTPQEKNMIAEAFQNKSVWIFYDGRKCCFDLINALSEVTNLTILCASEFLMHEIKSTLVCSSSNERSHKVKIAIKNLLVDADSKPDILFFNTPLLHLDSSEDNLKEALIKNSSDVADIVEIATKLKVKFAFMLSTLEAFNTQNWIGATQRLGELCVQYSSNRKTHNQTKFRIIRIPNCVTDPSELFEKITEDLQQGRYTDFKKNQEEDQSQNLCNAYYGRDEIFHPFLKVILNTLRDSYILPDIYSIIPKSSPKSIEEVSEIAAKLLGIRVKENTGIENYGKEAPVNFNDSELFEETNIDPAIVRTRFSTSAKHNEISYWTTDQINAMSTRDIISIVFQSVKEKQTGKKRTKHGM